jgi:DNA-directed RNA polymerase subunit K/omega
MMNYEKFKKTYKSQPVLNKFEKTKIISERSQQLANGSISFLKNPESYSSIYEIAIEELRQKKIPFILKRPIANSFEYWKLEDLQIM